MRVFSPVGLWCTQLDATWTLKIKGEWGTLDRLVSPDWTVQPQPNLGHGAIFCLIWGTVLSWIQETGWEQGSFLLVWVFFTVRGYILITDVLTDANLLLGK